MDNGYRGREEFHSASRFLSFPFSLTPTLLRLRLTIFLSLALGIHLVVGIVVSRGNEGDVFRMLEIRTSLHQLSTGIRSWTTRKAYGRKIKNRLTESGSTDSHGSLEFLASSDTSIHVRAEVLTRS